MAQGLTPNEWGPIEWTITTVTGAVIGAIGWLWRLATRVALLDRDVRAMNQDVIERHQENVNGRNDLMGEMRQLRQTIESVHRDLTRRIDNVYRPGEK